MKIELNEILYAVSSGLDAVEQELLGTKNGHCKRIAGLSVMLGKALGLTPDELVDLAAFSILHDNALTQVNQEEIEYRKYNNDQGYSEIDFNIRRCITNVSLKCLNRFIIYHISKILRSFGSKCRYLGGC